jgi:hypothetical protein
MKPYVSKTHILKATLSVRAQWEKNLEYTDYQTCQQSLTSPARNIFIKEFVIQASFKKKSDLFTEHTQY